MIGSICDLI